MSLYTFETPDVNVVATRWAKAKLSKHPLISIAMIPSNSEYFYSINIYSKKFLKKRNFLDYCIGVISTKPEFNRPSYTMMDMVEYAYTVFDSERVNVFCRKMMQGEDSIICFAQSVEHPDNFSTYSANSVPKNLIPLLDFPDNKIPGLFFK